jgi:murein DD-endopeptidase MepM/ murein hydrolase activator NlpD
MLNRSSNDMRPVSYPLDAYTASGPFSVLHNGEVFENKYHAAEDIGGAPGTPVYAMADGIISYSGESGGYGWLIIIDHPLMNVYSLYGHLSPSRWHMESGAVTKGELIAYLGDSSENGSSAKYGRMTPHLHFGIRQGQRTDYPKNGDWRWMAGWTYACPEEIGWLQPSRFISDTEVDDDTMRQQQFQAPSAAGWRRYTMPAIIGVWATVVVPSSYRLFRKLRSSARGTRDVD